MLTLSQHAKIDNFEDTQAAFEILNFISRILNHNTLRDISVFVQTHKYHRLIKYEKGEHGNDILTIMGNAAVTFDHDGIIVEEQEWNDKILKIMNFSFLFLEQITVSEI